MDEATILEWKVRPGDALVPGEVIVVIDTEKSEMDVEAIRPGVLTEIVVAEGHTVPVGTVLARYDEPARAPARPAAGDGEARPGPGAVPAPPGGPGPVPAGGDEPLTPAPPREPAYTAPGAGPPIPGPAPREPVIREPAYTAPAAGPPPPGPAPREPVTSHVAVAEAPARARSQVAASPLARRLALERQLDLAALTGTGPGGAVIARDVERGSAGGPLGAGRAAADRASGMRRAIAALMARSKREVPHYYLDDDIDLGPSLARLRRLNEALPVADRLVPAALLLRATAQAAAATPELNGHLLPDGFAPADRVNLGVAVSLRSGGLVAPAIMAADRLSLGELMAALVELVARARSGRLKPAELAEATITVTNLGDHGVRTVHPVIVPPQVAMVGFGRISERAVVVDGEVRAAPVVTASLAADHRVSDGMGGARFLTRIGRHLADLDTLFGTEHGGVNLPMSTEVSTSQ
jgi:pyruvate dehydrogenase E2 component (dihydrolipoamide acetyltransferase)